MTKRCFWVYILHCNNDTYYTGYTNQLAHRYQSHCNGTGKCKYTRSFKPLKMAQCWEIKGDKAYAMKIERYIKALSRSEKEQYILMPALLAQQFDVIVHSHQSMQLLLI